MLLRSVRVEVPPARVVPCGSDEILGSLLETSLSVWLKWCLMNPSESSEQGNVLLAVISLVYSHWHQTPRCLCPLQCILWDWTLEAAGQVHSLAVQESLTQKRILWCFWIVCATLSCQIFTFLFKIFVGFCYFINFSLSKLSGLFLFKSSSFSLVCFFFWPVFLLFHKATHGSKFTEKMYVFHKIICTLRHTLHSSLTMEISNEK